MIRAILILLALSLPIGAAAQAVKATSGEHDGFTRLVLDFGAPVDWQVGRTTDGYELRLAEGRRSYDLTGVFRLIGRSRLASVWSDPETGALRVGIGCACHAQPFEFRPGIVVIDLKDGPPPQASSFEASLTGEAMPGLSPRPVSRPRPRVLRGKTYDWTARALQGPDMDGPMRSDAGPPSAQATLTDPDPDLTDLHAALLQQLSHGAARGVVDMALPAPTGLRQPAQPPRGVQIRLEEVPGVRLAPTGEAALGLAASGQTCASDAQLDIGNWGDGRPAAEQITEARNGLMGEFDVPDPAVQQRAVRLYLHLGLGAEARQLLTALPPGQPDAALWTSMARILDDEVDPSPIFWGKAACDTAAALWAVLTGPPPLPGEEIDRAAALRSFSLLPVHLRRLLGPRLAVRFIAQNDASAAETVRNAVARAPGKAGPDVALMEAQLDVAAGKPDLAAARLEPMIDASGPATPDALLELVNTRVAQRRTVEAGQIIALEGLLHERRNSAEEAPFTRALALAKAVSGEFDGAFVTVALPGGTDDLEREVWGLLAEMGADSALLAHAVLPAGQDVSAPPPVAAVLAARLTALGFPEAAQDWLDRVPQADPILAAQIALRQRDGRLALRLVAGLQDPAALPLRAQALTLLGDDAALANVLDTDEDQAARWRAVGRARDWPRLAAEGPAPWKEVAALIPPQANDPAASDGPLARGAALLDNSLATRTAVDLLLAAVAPPDR